MQPVQDKRDQKQVPGGMRLHQYANLYFNARNPMLFKRLNEAEQLCVLRVSKQVLGIEGSVITDQNAASDYVRFLHPSQWSLLQFDDIFALDWRHPGDQIAYWRHKARMCAEILVPGSVDANHISGAYVISDGARSRLDKLGSGLPAVANPVLFFAQ